MSIQKHDNGWTSVSLADLDGETVLKTAHDALRQDRDRLAAQNAELGERVAVLQSQVDNADTNLEQIRLIERSKSKEVAAQNAAFREALEEIAKGRGPYNRDPLEHASNTVEFMKLTARDALAALTPAAQENAPRKESEL